MRTTLLCLLCLAPATGIAAERSFKLGPTSITFDEARLWAPAEASFAGQPVFGDDDANSAVLEFAGDNSAKLEDLQFILDGKEVTTFGSFTGSLLEVHRSVRMGDAAWLTSRLDVSDTGLLNQVVIEGYDAANAITAAFPFAYDLEPGAPLFWNVAPELDQVGDLRLSAPELLGPAGGVFRASLAVQFVPEPGSLLLLVTGALLVALRKPCARS